jgi:phenylpyruvate tautomerase PptA (4-oxalocrotonate tautomerase family)
MEAAGTFADVATALGRVNDRSVADERTARKSGASPGLGLASRGRDRDHRCGSRCAYSCLPDSCQGQACGRLQVHEPHRFAHPPTLAEPEYATLVSVDCFAGRSVEAKRRLYGEIVDRLEPLGIPRDHVSITLRESPTENWGIRGGQAACDVDLGFNVKV